MDQTMRRTASMLTLAVVGNKCFGRSEIVTFDRCNYPRYFQHLCLIRGQAHATSKMGGGPTIKIRK